jgi:hypothetical protein
VAARASGEARTANHRHRAAIGGQPNAVAEKRHKGAAGIEEA